MNPRIRRQYKYWMDSVDHDLDIAKALWRSRKYDACLFFCHLVIEKLLKGAVVKKTGKDAPRVHNLIRLAELSSLSVTDNQKEMVAKINHFNIAVRYPVDNKELYKLATKKYAEPFYLFTKGFILWVRKNLA